MNNEDLKKQIAELTKKVDALYMANSIPLRVDQAFQERGFLKEIEVQSLDPLVYDNLNTLVPTPSGDFPVIAFPVRWIKLTQEFNGGGNFYIPAYTLYDI